MKKLNRNVLPKWENLDWSCAYHPHLDWMRCVYFIWAWTCKYRYMFSSTQLMILRQSSARKKTQFQTEKTQRISFDSLDFGTYIGPSFIPSIPSMLSIVCVLREKYLIESNGSEIMKRITTHLIWFKQVFSFLSLL